MNYILYNPLSDNGSGKINAQKIKELLPSEKMKFIDITEVDFADFLKTIPDSERVILSGGDGTIHYLVNQHKYNFPEREIYYYPAGSGNDFKTDLNKNNELILLNPYIKNLPTVRVNGQELLFLNGIGYGIDGYCCEEGDRQRKLSVKSINYTSIAVKGLLFYFKPRNAVIIVDGVRHEYKHVWLAATMNGRFYGGGMMVAPGQDRLNKEHLVSTIVMHCPSKLKTLMAFPSIFKGGHVKKKKIVEVLTGHEITVTFDAPTPLQVDGETFSGISTYFVSSAGADVNAASEFENAVPVLNSD